MKNKIKFENGNQKKINNLRNIFQPNFERQLKMVTKYSYLHGWHSNSGTFILPWKPKYFDGCCGNRSIFKAAILQQFFGLSSHNFIKFLSLFGYVPEQRHENVENCTRINRKAILIFSQLRSLLFFSNFKYLGHVIRN